MTGAGTARASLTCGAIAGPVFVVVFLIEGATRPDYSVLRHPVSSLSLGGSGWTQVASFALTGALLIAFAAGLRTALRRDGAGVWASLLIALAGLGLIGAGLFPADPIGGYPPGTPAVPAVRTAGGLAHDGFSTLFFLSLPAACLVVAYRMFVSGRQGWAAYCAGTAVAFLTCCILASAGFTQRSMALVPIGGLLQRVALVVGLGWTAALALHLLRRSSA